MTASQIAPLAVAIPLVAGAACEFCDSWAPRWVIHFFSIAGALASAVASGIVTAAAAHGTVVHWFGGWHPGHGVALGIAFVVDPVGGALAAFVGLLTTAAFIFAWTYYDEGGSPFHSLMLLFLAAMSGFFLTGDLFNLFVFFELMGVAAYALTGYRTEDESAVMGAISFAVVNSAGAFLILTGIALVYGRTGALNMAQIAHALGHHADPLVVVAFSLIAVGLLTKAAIVPFQFWLADAHAVAPTPLCVLFSGIMVQAGLYAVARVYWSVFSGALGGHEHALRSLLLAFGLLTCAAGAIMCFRQRHLKRLLAFSTITHSGIILSAVALFSAQGLAGAWVYILGHGLVKGSLFMCSGVVLNRLRSLDVDALRGKLYGRWWLVTLLALGALGLAGLPPFGTFLGKSLIDDAAKAAGLAWLPYVLLVAAAVTGGSVLNALARMTFGWGPERNDEAEAPKEETTETGGDQPGMPAVMLATATVVLALAIAGGFFRAANPLAIAASQHFVDRTLQAAIVLGGAHPKPLPPEAASSLRGGAFWGGVSALLAIALAAWGCFGYRLTGAKKEGTGLGSAAFGWLQRLHSGKVTDYVAWLAAGAVAFGLTLAAVVR